MCRTARPHREFQKGLTVGVGRGRAAASAAAALLARLSSFSAFFWVLLHRHPLELYAPGPFRQQQQARLGSIVRAAASSICMSWTAVPILVDPWHVWLELSWQDLLHRSCASGQLQGDRSAPSRWCEVHTAASSLADPRQHNKAGGLLTADPSRSGGADADIMPRSCRQYRRAPVLAQRGEGGDGGGLVPRVCGRALRLHGHRSGAVKRLRPWGASRIGPHCSSSSVSASCLDQSLL